MTKCNLLIFTTGLAHPLGHRSSYLLPFLQKEFNTLVISLSPFSNFLKDKRLIILKNKNFVEIRDTPFAFQWTFPLSSIWIMFCIRFFLKRRILGFSPDVILATDPLISFPAILVRKFIKNPAFIYEDIDEFSELYSNNLKKNLMKKIEKYIITKADYIITVGKYLKERCEKIRKSSKDISVIYNGAFYPKTLNLKNKKYDLIYIGILSDYGLDKVIDAISLLKKNGKKVTFLIIGDGRLKGYLIKKRDKMQLKKQVIFLGKIPRPKVLDCFRKAKIGMATYPPTDFMRYAFTLKIIEYLAGGLPVITTVGETAEIVQKEKCGMITGYDEKEIAESIKRLLTNKELYKKMVQNCRKVAKKFDWKNLAKLETQTIKKVIKTHKKFE